MKLLISAFMAAVLTGCATAPPRTADVMGDAPLYQAATQTPMQTNSPEGRAVRTAYQNFVPDSAPQPESAVSPSREKKQFGVIDYLWDRFRDRPASPTTGTIFDTRDGGDYPFPLQDANDDRGAPLSSNFSHDYGVLPATYSAPVSGSTPPEMVYLPDPVNDRFDSGRPPIYVGVNGPQGDAVDVVIDDQPHFSQQPSYYQRLMAQPLVYNLVEDQKNFYSCRSLAWLGVGLGGTAILANTSLDEQFREFVHGPSNKNSTDFNWMKGFGTGQYVIPALAGIYAVNYWLDENAGPGERPVAEWLEQWSGRSMRGLVVGAVPVLAFQYILGSSRPGESSSGSHWKPFQDNNGVSGHAFVGAVPFWTAAQMTDYVPLQVGFYTMGTLAGISRIHTDSHYLSQVVMGWWIAGLSVAAVNETEWQKRQWLVTPTLIDGGPGLAVMHQW
jgi:hypothetical protein